MTLAVFLPNWVGDLAMATPTLRALRRHQGPAARIVGLVRPGLAEVLAGTPWIDDFIYFDPPSSDPALRTRAVIARLRAERCQAALLLTNSWRTALVAWAARIERRIGYARAGRGWLLTERLHAPRRGWRYVPTSAVDYYLELARAWGCRSLDAGLELATTPDDERAADAVWAAQGWSAETRVVALNNSGAFGAAKLWPLEHCAEVARELTTRQGVGVLVLCGPQERESARSIVARADHPGVASLAESTPSIGLTKACLRRSRLLITTDSGPRHFGTAFDVPVITLFGPTHQAWSETRHPWAVALQEEVPCGPCQRRVCPLGHHRCMRDLRPRRVLAAAEAVLDKPQSGQRRPAA